METEEIEKIEIDIDDEAINMMMSGVLLKFGYYDIKNKTQEERKEILNNALKELDPITIFRRINAMYVIERDHDKELGERLKEDRDYIKTTKEYANRATPNVAS